MGPIVVITPIIYMKLYSYILRTMGIKFTGSPRYSSTKAHFDECNKISLGKMPPTDICNIKPIKKLIIMFLLD